MMVWETSDIEKCSIYNVKRKMAGFKTGYLIGSHLWKNTHRHRGLFPSTNSTPITTSPAS